VLKPQPPGPAKVHRLCQSGPKERKANLPRQGPGKKMWEDPDLRLKGADGGLKV